MKQIILPLIAAIAISFNLHAQNYVWAKYFGEAVANSIALDAANNIYSCGSFSNSVDFNPLGSHFLKSSLGLGDAFVIKTDNAGNFKWVKTMGATGGIADATGLTVDKQGNSIIIGYFSDSVDFDPGPATYFLHSKGGISDIFMVKLDSNGNFIWAKSYGSPGNDWASSAVTDKNNNIYVAGYFADTVDFNPGGSGGQVISKAGGDIYVLKLDPAGNFKWVAAAGGISEDRAYSIALDKNGNVFTTGYFGDTVDFDPGPGVYSLGSPGMQCYVQKLDSNGNFVWARAMGSLQTEGQAIDIDNSGNCLVTGYYMGRGDFDPGPDSLIFNSRGIFTLKLNNNGDLIWGTNIIAPDNINALGITHDKHNNIYRTGMFNDNVVDFDPSPTGYFQLLYNDDGNGFDDLFIDKVDSNGKFKWAVSLGGYEEDMGKAIVVDTNQSIYFCGLFSGEADLDPGLADSHTYGFGPGQNALIEKLDSSCPAVTIALSGNELSVSSLWYRSPIDSYMFYWVNCTTGDTVSSGSTNTFFHPTANGSYALILRHGYCTGRSACLTVTGVDVKSIALPPAIVSIYPVPAEDVVHIEWDKKVSIASLIVYNTTGKHYSLPYRFSGNKMDIDCSQLTSGNYIISMIEENGNSITKQVLIERN